jgi:hypothetical protein
LSSLTENVDTDNVDGNESTDFAFSKLLCTCLSIDKSLDELLVELLDELLDEVLDDVFDLLDEFDELLDKLLDLLLDVVLFLTFFLPSLCNSGIENGILISLLKESLAAVVVVPSIKSGISKLFLILLLSSRYKFFIDILVFRKK